MQSITIDAAWEKEIILGKEVLDYLQEQGASSIALFASVQFLKLDTVKKQLKDADIAVKTTKAKRTDVEGQILGCDAYHDSFEEDVLHTADAALYIGDGLFHPKALLLAQIYKKTMKEIVIWDPVSEKMRMITKDAIIQQINKTRANLKRFIAASSIGILVTMKPGQQYLTSAKNLKEHLAQQGKNAFIFIDDTLKLSNLEDYPFVEAWVNTACPRIGLDDLTTIEKPLINIREALDPVKALEGLQSD